MAIVGAAGVGKARLVYEVIHSHRTQGWLVLESASVSYGKATPYFPVLDLLKRYTHVEEGDDIRTIRARVTGQVLSLDEALQETVPAFLWLLEACRRSIRSQPRAATTAPTHPERAQGLTGDLDGAMATGQQALELAAASCTAPWR